MKRLDLLFSAFILIALLTTGCAVYSPQPITLTAGFPDSFVEQDGASAATPLRDKWWEAFNDPVLNELMEITFAQNLDLAQAYARLKQFEAVYKKTEVAELPFINLEGEGSRSKQTAVAGGNTVNAYRLSLAAGYEIDVWQKLKSRTQASRLQMEASLEDIKTLYLSLSAEVADLYYLIVEQCAQIELTDRTIASYSDTLRRVEKRYREGLVPAVDVYQARQNLSAAKARRPDFEASLAAAEHALSILVGRFPDRNISTRLTVMPQAPAAFPEGLPSEVLIHRPDIQSELLRLKASDEEIAVAVSDRFPSFNLLAHYGTAGTTNSNGTISGTVWDLIGNLAVPLLDWGGRKAEVERTKAVFEEQLFRYRQKVLQAFQEVEDALSNNRTSEIRIARLEEREKATSAALRLSTERYMQGITDYLPVLTAQILHFDTQSQLLASRRQLISDRISLARSLGGTWMQKETENRLYSNRTNG